MINLRLLPAVFLLAFLSSSAQAEIHLTIGEPSSESIKSGIGLISGWAVSDHQIVSVEALINDVSLGNMPYGGSRLDVAAVFPDLPDSENSGWAMKWNYALLADGEYRLKVIATDDSGAVLVKELNFFVTGFHAEFIADPGDVQIANALVQSTEDGKIAIQGALVEGETVDFRLAWDTPSQQFLIDQVEYAPGAEENQSPTANAGNDKTVEQEASVVVSGSASDPDGSIVSWSWQQISGPGVSLSNANSDEVSFTAPNTAGDIRLRLTVTDDDGASDSDDVVITVREPLPEPNQPPTADAGDDQTVDQDSSVTITGSASDTDGTIVSWSWQQVSGASVSLSNSNTSAVSFTAPNVAGDILLRLTVNDDDGSSDSDDVVITVREDPNNDTTTGSTVESMLSFINAARGVARACGSTDYPAQPPFQWSNSLANVAMEHSMDMARQGYFSHTSLDGTSMGTRVFAGWNGTRVGENIAASSANVSDSGVVDLWLNSPGHCALIMDPLFSHAGIGSGQDTQNNYTFHYFWTLDFGG